MRISSTLPSSGFGISSASFDGRLCQPLNRPLGIRATLAEVWENTFAAAPLFWWSWTTCLAVNWLFLS